MENNSPYILEETDDFAVIFKPPKMHSVPLKQKEEHLFNGSKSDDITLLEWYAKNYPPVFDIMHRLDFETHGLVLFAKNSKTYDFFSSAQDRGEFVKEYSAVCSNSVFNSQTVISPASGFPPPLQFTNNDPTPEKPLIVMSYFRPFGPGRKLVRPVTDVDKKHKEIAKDNGGFYRTEIINRDGNVFTVRIKRGFRHQIRAHLCWIGYPILNDPLYREQGIEKKEERKEKKEQGIEGGEQGMLALRAHALFFSDPSSGKPRECRIAPLEK